MKPTLVSIISDVLASILTPPAKPAPATPLQGATMLASLAAVRDELERTAARRYGATVADAVAQLVDDTPNVLVIGVDGTNLSRVLAHPELTQNFFKLIQGGTTAASTIVGHTTVSNPSWSSILTGLWGETTGVINNVFTPWTYEKWPTLFTQLESADPSIVTTSIANWDVISAIATSGLGVDNVVNVPEQEDDPLWFKADDLVGDFTEAAIADASAAVANLIFSYFVGVDEAGHAFGGESPEYLEALANFDRNLGEIMAAVDAWEAATGEQWTILMVTDHGHQPQLGFGHGFQSPAETTTFVVANNPDLFQQGGVNLKYSIVDVTATVLDLFGHQPGVTDGVSLLDLDDSTVTPGDDDALLRKALQDAIAMYGYPDIATNLALSVRTIAATIPYYVNNVFNGVQSGLQSLADADIFLISPLAALAIIPVRIIGDLTYIAVNIPAQIIARLTGVTGASIFPLVRPQTPVFPIPEAGDQTPTLLAAACTEGRVTSAVFACGAAALAS
ncbi:alkaline phosphatase family protein [Mycolicibacterium parafortuitum]|uniref:alkaline phosphatase family protein n=1 Tax=Mycolicibacterium parafortuitum TaxID=39692 RepID=UPI001F31D723|nr:alkaline phosphatase family protein [Mycolicibacterium parafortuitum]